MLRYASFIFSLMLCAFLASAKDDVATAVAGTVKKIDTGTKTVVVDTADGTEHTFHYVDRTAVHGTEAAEKGGKETLHGLKEGSDVAVHYTTKGSEKTADEIDYIGKDGLRVTEGTVSHIDRGAKTIAVKTADGAEETFRLSDRAARDSGKDIATDAQKSAKVTVYYTDKAGHKVAHFLKEAI
jgi:hypothetical protein